MADLFGRGKSVQFGPGEVEITGSPLFEPANRHGCVMRIRTDRAMALTVRLFDGEESLAELPALPGRLTGGRDEYEFNTTMPAAPIRFRVGHVAGKPRGEFNVSFDLAPWDGVRLSAARMFRSVVRFVTDLSRATRGTLTYHIDGETLPFATVRLGKRSTALLSRVFPLLRMIESVCTHFGLDPVLNMREWQDMKDVRILADLIERGEHTHRVDDRMCLTMRPARDDLRALLPHWKAGRNDMLMTTEVSFDVLGERVVIPDMAVRLDRVRMMDRGRVASDAAGGGADRVRVELRSCKRASVTYRRAADCPGLSRHTICLA